MSDRELYYRYEQNQLTCYTENRNILIDRLVPVMTKLREQYALQGWTGIIDPLQAAVHAVVEFTLVSVGDGWIAYSVVQPWFLEHEVLTEEFICDVPLPLAVDILKAIARDADCERIIIGTRAAPGGKHFGLAKHYQQLGLAVSTIELTLETPCPKP